MLVHGGQVVTDFRKREEEKFVAQLDELGNYDMECSDASARAGTWSLTGATARAACWPARLTGTSKHVWRRIVGADFAPEFMPKRNFAPIRNRGCATDDTERLEIGEYEGTPALGTRHLQCRDRGTQR